MDIIYSKIEKLMLRLGFIASCKSAVGVCLSLHLDAYWYAHQNIEGQIAHL